MNKAPAWIQSISIAIIALILLTGTVYGVVKYLEIKAALSDAFDQPTASATCTPDPGTYDC
jgi:hypothetical protein